MGDLDRSFPNLQNLEEISLPFFKMKLNLFHAYKLLDKYFTLTNNKDNFIILIYDYDKRLIRESMLITVGVGESIIQDVIIDPVPEDFNVEGEEIMVFQSIIKFVQNKYSTQIARVIILEIRFMENVLKEIQKEEEIDDNGLIERLLRIFSERHMQVPIKVYPESPLLSAIKRFSTIVSADFLGKFLKNVQQYSNRPITFFDADWYISFLRNTSNSKPEITVSSPYEFGRISIKDHFQWMHFLSKFNAKYHTKPNYFLDIDWCVDFLSDMCESEFPLTKARFEYLLQRLMFFIKQNEELWDVTPKPKVYNGYTRLLTRLFGFYINPRKLSYWSIPSNLTQILRESFGPSDQFIVFLTENNNYTEGWKINLDKSAIIEITRLNISQINPILNDEALKSINAECGFTKVVVQIDKILLKSLMKLKKKPLKFLSFLFLIRKLNNEKNFSCYPPLPWYTFIKKSGTVRSFRYMNKFLYDFLEF